MIRSSLFVLSTTGIALILASACGGGDSNTAPPNVPSASGSTTVMVPTTGPTGSSTAPANACAAAGGTCQPLSVTPCAGGHAGDPITYACTFGQLCCLPGGGGGTNGGGGSTAQALDPNAAAAATGALGIFAASEAPGMTKDGAPIAGSFQEGQTLEAPFTLQPGKCYTLVGAGAGITQLELEMQYTTPVPGLNPSIGKSTSSGALASMGGKGQCLRPLSPIAAPAKIIVRAAKGTGLAAAQLYVK